jgi:LysR family glycine cleavage system transcriptional activator
MHALHALDAFARTGTVWEAAERLGITRSALSHRLAMLETVLGFEVAVRSGKGIALTPRGRRYALEVQKSLAVLHDAQDEGHKPIGGNLRISSTPGFASMWLCNHIGAFHGEHPDLNLQIVAGRELDDVEDREIDLFIVFGEGSWPKHHVQHLYEVEFLPMCSPALLNMQARINEPADLLRFPLLHLNTWDDWRQWLSQNGVQLPRGGAGIRFSDLMLVQSAAINAQGVMMGDEITCSAALASGQLVCPFAAKVKSNAGYYLVRSGHRRPSAASLAFSRWLNLLVKRVGAELQLGPR